MNHDPVCDEPYITADHEIHAKPFADVGRIRRGLAEHERRVLRLDVETVDYPKLPDKAVGDRINQRPAARIANILERPDDDHRMVRTAREGNEHAGEAVDQAWRASGDAGSDFGHQQRGEKKSSGGSQPIPHPHHRGVASKRDQITQQRIDRFVATLRLAIASPINGAREAKAQAGLRAVDADPVAALVSTADIANRATPHRIGARCEMEEQDSKAVDITPHCRWFPGKDFGSHVQRRPGQRRGGIVIELAAGAEVHQQDPPVLGLHHIRRFDVAVQQTCGVHGGDSPANLHTDPGDLRRAERRRCAALRAASAAGSAERLGEFLVRVPHLQPADDRFSLLRPQRRQGALVPLHGLASNRYLERGPTWIGFGTIKFVQLRPTAFLAQLVPNVIQHGLPQVRLKGAGAANIELIQSPEGPEQGVLDEIVGVGRIARPLGQPAPGPPAERRQVAGHKVLERLLVSPIHAVDEAEGGFGAIRSRSVREPIGVVVVVRHDSADCRLRPSPRVHRIDAHARGAGPECVAYHQVGSVSSRRMASTRSAGTHGFARCQSHPARIALARSCGMAAPVSAMIGTVMVRECAFS
jgi:hypothetical protein